ncbi:hypothetical protein [Paenibacillus gansuensis]|uniref:DUF4362 domain-containing protein n=1 Tax=Paenibacillus gansuensis TaxID=306542 RepID=A0ABW5PK31_9BACL
MIKLRTTLLTLILILLVSCSSKGSLNTNLLTAMDAKDQKRMALFVERFQNRKMDYLVAIQKSVEGTYTIYDVRSDGRAIHVRIDASRDMGGPNTELTCSKIRFKERNGLNWVRVGNCQGPDGKFDEAGLLSFSKE